MCAYCTYTSRTLHFCCLDMGDLTSGTLGFKSAEGIGFQSFFQPIPHGTKLVGGLEHFLLFHILGIISSQLIFIFFRGVGQPPTSCYQWYFCWQVPKIHHVDHCDYPIVQCSKALVVDEKQSSLTGISILKVWGYSWDKPIPNNMILVQLMGLFCNDINRIIHGID